MQISFHKAASWLVAARRRARPLPAGVKTNICTTVVAQSARYYVFRGSGLSWITMSTERCAALCPRAGPPPWGLRAACFPGAEFHIILEGRDGKLKYEEPWNGIKWGLGRQPAGGGNRGILFAIGESMNTHWQPWRPCSNLQSLCFQPATRMAPCPVTS